MSTSGSSLRTTASNQSNNEEGQDTWLGTDPSLKNQGRTVRFSDGNTPESEDKGKKDSTAEAKESKKEVNDIIGDIQGLLTVGDFSLLGNVTNFIEWSQEHSPYQPRMAVPFWLFLFVILNTDTKVEFLMSPVSKDFIMKDSIEHLALVQNNNFKYFSMVKTMIVVCLILLAYLFSCFKFLVNVIAKIVFGTCMAQQKESGPNTQTTMCVSIQSEERCTKYSTLICRVILTYVTVGIILYFFTISTYNFKENFSYMFIEFVDHEMKVNLFPVAYVSAGLTNVSILLLAYAGTLVVSNLPTMINLNEVLKEGMEEGSEERIPVERLEPEEKISVEVSRTGKPELKTEFS